MRPLAIHLGIPHEPDLSWYYEKAPKLRSNFGILADAAQGGWGSGRNDPHAVMADDRRLEDIRKAKLIWRRLHELSVPIRNVLKAAYERTRTSPQTDGKLGALANVALQTAAFKAIYEPWSSTPTECLVALCTSAKRTGVVDAMRLQASAMVEVAAYAWRMTRSGCQAHPPSDDTLARAEAAWRHVEPPRRQEAPRTWRPMGITPGWVSPREQSLGITAASWEPVKERKERP